MHFGIKHPSVNAIRFDFWGSFWIIYVMCYVSQLQHQSFLLWSVPLTVLPQLQLVDDTTMTFKTLFLTYNDYSDGHRKILVLFSGSHCVLGLLKRVLQTLFYFPSLT